MSNLVVAITGASGSAYAVRLLEILLESGHSTHITISPSGAHVLRHEVGIEVDLENFAASQLLGHVGTADVAARLLRTVCRKPTANAPPSQFHDPDWLASRLVYHHYQDFRAGIASGSFRTDGMVVCPCSMGTLAAVANGLSTNLIHRAADVHLKERRKLIVVPRETPLGSIQLENMKRLADAGAVILPAAPGFYHDPHSMHDLIDFIVGRICDQLGVEQSLTKRWGDPLSLPTE